MTDVSVLRQVFIGTVAADIRYGSDLIEVHPTEKLPNFKGKLDTGYEVRTCQVQTPTGSEEVKIVFSTCIQARWLAINTNRKSAPDVVAGERVLIWRNGDSNQYYWECLGQDQHLRHREHLLIALSNTADTDKKSKILDLTNAYIIEADTRNKKVGVYTNKNDGEPFAYTIKLDTKAGNHIVRDDGGNHMLLDSANTLIEFENAEKSVYRLDKKDIYEYCVGNRRVEVGGDNEEIYHGNNTRTVGKDETIKVTGKQSSTIDGGTSLKTPTYSCKSNSNAWQTPSSSFSGHVSMASLSVGAARFTSVAAQAQRIGEQQRLITQRHLRSVVGTITGNFKVIGSLDVSESVSAGGMISAPNCSFAGGNVPVCPAGKH